MKIQNKHQSNLNLFCTDIMILQFSGPLPKNTPEAKNSPRKAKTHARMFAHILAPKLHFEIWWALLLVKNSSSNNNIILIIQSYHSSFNSTAILFRP